MFRLGVQKYEWLGRYIPRDSYLIARQWANELNTEDLLNAKYNQWTIGDWIQSSVHTHLRIPHLDFDKPAIEKVFRSYLYSGLIACFGLTQLLNEYKPDVLLQFNGRMSSTRVAIELAKQRGIYVVCHERGYRHESIRLTVNESGGALEPYKQLHKNWENIPLVQGEIEKITQYMIGKQYGKDSGWTAYSPPPQKQDKVKKNNQPNRLLWVLFVSSEDEGADIKADQKGPFKSQMDWIQRTIKFIEAHPEVNLVIRVHPNIAGKRASGQSLSQLHIYEELNRRLPKNVTMIFPDDPVSSYDLMDHATVGLVYFSTVGLEMACKGKQVVVAANSRMVHPSFLRMVYSPENYETLLHEMLNIRQDAVYPNIKRLAHRHAYALFFRYNIPFPLVKMQDKTHGIPAYTSANELLPGREPNLDRVCRIILKKEPVIPTPTDEERHRSEEDEIAWFKLDGQKEAKNHYCVRRKEHFPEISIVVPTYNYGHFIDQCLQSILDQTFQDYEVIIMDDYSSDATKNIVQKYLGDRRIRYLKNKANLKQPRNCNKGAMLAKGEYICFLHADDMFLPHNLEKKIQVLRKNLNIAAVFSGVYLMNADGNIVQELKHEGRPDLNYVGERDDYHDLMKNNYIPTPSDVLIRKECFQKVGGFNEKLINGCDWELWIRLAKEYKLAFIREPLIAYRMHGANLHTDLRRKNDVVVKDHFWIIDNHLQVNDEIIQNVKVRDKAYFQLFKTIGEIPRSYEKLYLDALNIRINPSILRNGDSDQINKLDIPQALISARDCQKNEDFIGAVKIYLNLLDRENVNRAAVNFQLGRIWMKLLEFSKAANCFIDFLENNPSYPEVYKYLGEAHHRINRYQKAETIFRKGIGMLPQAYQLRKGIIDLYLEQWRIDDAIRELQRHLKLYTDDTHAAQLLEECCSTWQYLNNG
jgi:glycosyltransferase involved in cell wall biosynthesis